MKALALLLLVLPVLMTQAEIACKDTYFWSEEGIPIIDDVVSPSSFGEQTIAHPHYTDLDKDTTFEYFGNHTLQPASGATGCDQGNTLTWELLQEPEFHTPTGDNYTPVFGVFAMNATTGEFTYVHIPTKCPGANNTGLEGCTFNGYDKFKYRAICSFPNGTMESDCDAWGMISVTFTSASTHRTRKNQSTPDVRTSGQATCKSGGQCLNGAWQATHELPRKWDWKTDGKHKCTALGGATCADYGKPSHTHTQDLTNRLSDDLDFEWTSNYGIITGYGVIGNVAQRFLTFQELKFKPGMEFTSANFPYVHTSFDISCLDNPANALATTNTITPPADPLSDKWEAAGWYKKFMGTYTNCTDLTNAANACANYPLLTPQARHWELEVDGCSIKWVGKFTWDNFNNLWSNKADKPLWQITKSTDTWLVKTEIYNTVVQPFSWTEPQRGWAEENHLYKLTFKLCMETEFAFELGIDIFTVDWEWFRYHDGAGDNAFGYNLITYPQYLLTLPSHQGNEPSDVPQPQGPDRRVESFELLNITWEAPTEDYPRVPDPNEDRISVFKGPPATAELCSNHAALLYDNIIIDIDGLSAQQPTKPTDGTPSTCLDTYQNITFRGIAKGSRLCPAGQNGTSDDANPCVPRCDDQITTNCAPDNEYETGFCGCLRVKFTLFNWEQPNFWICMRILCTSLCTEGSFSGSTAVCRGSFYWPVYLPADDNYGTPEFYADTALTNSDNITVLGPLQKNWPAVLCDEVDARTFGPHDWAIVMFDIHDVWRNLTELKSATLTFSKGTGDSVADILKVSLYGTNAGFVDVSPAHDYLNYRNLCPDAAAATPDCIGLEQIDNEPKAPYDMDWGFAFTPGAYNENVKITIKVVLKILSTQITDAPKRRFSPREAAPQAENQMFTSMNIDKKFTEEKRLGKAFTARGATAQTPAATSGSNASLMAVGGACAVLLVAAIGMAVVAYRATAHKTPAKGAHTSSFSAAATTL